MRSPDSARLHDQNRDVEAGARIPLLGAGQSERWHASVCAAARTHLLGLVELPVCVPHSTACQSSLRSRGLRVCLPRVESESRCCPSVACLGMPAESAPLCSEGVHRRAQACTAGIIPSSGALVVLDLTAVPISMRKACLPRRPVWRRISLTMRRTTWTSGRSDSSRCAPSATVRKIWFELSAVSLAREAGVRDYRPLL